MLVGRKIMAYLGISIEDFFVAGGAILFVIAAKDLVTGKPTLRLRRIFSALYLSAFRSWPGLPFLLRH